MKYSIPLALLVAARILAEGVNAAFTVMSRSLICHLMRILTTAWSLRPNGESLETLEKVRSKTDG